MDVSEQSAPVVEPIHASSTVVALFEDAIDAERALIALRKANQAASRVSVLVRKEETRRQADDAVDVARDIVAVALGAVANWLIGLAELIVSERGKYVVAGPMGAALSGVGLVPGDQDAGGGKVAGASTDLSADRLRWVLIEFGLGEQEADYVDNRLSAGATLIGLTVTDPDQLDETRRVFGDHDAVYIAVVPTDTGVLQATGALLERLPDLVGVGEVVVADVVARVRPVTDHEALAGIQGIDVSCRAESGSCHIDRVLVEDIVSDTAGDEAQGRSGPAVEMRYVVVSFGGVLGLGKHRVAVPAALVDLTDPPRLNVDRDELQRAPHFDEDVPLSRNLEEQIFRYFDVTPYWVATNAAGTVDAVEGDAHGRDSERARSH